MYSFDKRVHNLHDSKGMKILAGGGTHAAIVQSLGAVQSNMTAADTYTALQRGLLDGAHFGDAIAPIFKADEVSKYRTTNGFNLITVEYCLNKDFWDSLPADLQVVFNAWLRQLAQAEAQGFYSYEDVVGLQKVKASGVEIIDLAPDELERWKAAVARLPEEWIAEQEADGRPGTQLIEDVRELWAQYTEMSGRE